jgi:hypothetical protein
MKAEEEKRLAREAEQQRRRETPGIWEYHIAKAEENNECHKADEREGTTSETWSLPRPERGIFSPFLHKFDKWLQWFGMVL